MTTKNRMFGKMLTSRLLKIMSITIVACMLVITMTACGTVSQQDIRPTVEHSTEAGEGYEPDNPEQNIDDGYWHDEDPTEEPSSTEEPTTTEPEVTEAPSGTYAYNVDGVEITLRTNIEDFIGERTGAIGTYQYVNLLGIAESLGYEHTGTMGDGSEVDLGRITNFTFVGNSGISVQLSDKRDQGYHTILLGVEDNSTTVNFNRYDITDDSITTYWVYNGEGSSVVCTVNYEEIVIFTYLLENGAFAPSEDWMETCGIAPSTGPSVYYVNK